jgi:hypothetical protein
LLDVGTQELGGPSGKRRSFQGDAHAGASQKADLGDKIFSGGGKRMGLEWVPSGERVASTVVVLWRSNAAKSAGCVFIARKSIVSTWRNCHAMIFPEIKHDSPNTIPQCARADGSLRSYYTGSATLLQGIGDCGRSTKK